MAFMLGCNLPLRTARVGGWFMVQRQDGSIQATLSLSAYFDQAESAPVMPDSVDWTAKAMAAIRRMYKNDSLGDCVIASLYHQLGLWTGNDSGTPIQATDAEVVAMYRIWNPRGDNGCDISTVLNYTRDHGAMVSGKAYKIDAYVNVDNTNKDLVKAANILFGTIKLGVDLPGAWEQVNDGGLWDVTSSRVIGGHDISTAGYNAQGVPIMTWGGLRTITWPAFTSTKYIKEAYAPLSPDWYGKDNVAPNGIDAATLKADLAAIANGQIPSVGPPQVPLDWLI
jgi:hypothetical protein